MTRLTLKALWLLIFVETLRAVRYADYPVGHMPQYSDRHEESDFALGPDEYTNRSPDAPAHLDYKYEERPHEKFDDLPLKDIIDERIRDEPIKKKRKHLISRSDRNPDLDKDALDETEPELISDKRFIMPRSKYQKRNFPKQSENMRHLKHNSMDQRGEIDNVDKYSDYIIHKEDVERANDVDAAEISQFRYRPSTPRKPRRKPRDRAIHQPELGDNNYNVKPKREEMDVRSDRESFKTKSPRRFEGIIQQENTNGKIKNDYGYDEYYDMKRVQHVKTRLPAFLRQSTVRTMEAQSTSFSGHGLFRRSDSFAELSGSIPVSAELTSGVISTTRTSTTTTSTMKTTSEITPSTVGVSSDMSLAEKSRLSILKKAQRKENSRNVSSSTKPPVLMQVTSKMQTVVMVEPRFPETAMRAREVREDSPERLKRARRLMRHKLVAGARSIHELTDNWDEMICDYIDVSLLDTDTAFYLEINRYITYFLIVISMFIYHMFY